LTQAVYRRLNLSRAECASIVEFILSEISARIAKGEKVKLSSFGSFRVRARGRRPGRNPKTGIEVSIAPRRVLTFKPSHALKASINGNAITEAKLERPDRAGHSPA
jgi:integration host factor subunit alpha